MIHHGADKVGFNRRDTSSREGCGADGQELAWFFASLLGNLGFVFTKKSELNEIKDMLLANKM